MRAASYWGRFLEGRRKKEESLKIERTGWAGKILGKERPAQIRGKGGWPSTSRRIGSEKVSIRPFIFRKKFLSKPKGGAGNEKKRRKKMVEKKDVPLSRVGAHSTH